MKMPTICPCCGGPLLNEYKLYNWKNRLKKSCTKMVNHKFTCISDDKSHDTMFSMGIEIDVQNMVRVNWLFEKQELFVCKGPLPRVGEPVNTHSLPYFEPDLSDYRKLVAKLQTYVTFL